MKIGHIVFVKNLRLENVSYVFQVMKNCDIINLLIPLHILSVYCSCFCTIKKSILFLD